MVPRSSQRAVVLLSGGPDSAVAAFQARQRGDELIVLTVINNERGSNANEVACAQAIASGLGIPAHEPRSLVAHRAFSGMFGT